MEEATAREVESRGRRYEPFVVVNFTNGHGSESPTSSPTGTEVVARAADKLLAKMNGADPPGPLAPEAPITVPKLLRKLAKALEVTTPVLEQSARWDSQVWHAGILASDDLHRDGKEALLGAVVRLSDAFSGRISRRQLFDFPADDDPIAYFVAVMAWGAPVTDHGWYRALTIANRYNVERFKGLLRKQIAASSRPDTAWHSWTLTAPIKGLGTASASRLAYFAGTDSASGRGGPLIADRHTAWAIWAFADDLGGTMTDGARYVRYVRTLDRWAGDGRADRLEYALAHLGPAVIRRWQRQLS